MTAQAQRTATASSGRLLSSSHFATREAVARAEGEPVTIRDIIPVAASPTQAPSGLLATSTVGEGQSRVWAVALGVVLLATTVLVGRALLAERQTVDDVFIFLRTARNLAEHGEMVFDAGVVGGARVEGTSSPAWTMLLAVLWRCGARGLGLAKLASLALAAFVPLACGLAAARAVEGGRRKALALAIPAVALAFDADLATWASSGMDTALWTLACVACVGLAHRPRAAALALGGLAWVRPEAPLFAALGVVALAHDRRSLARLACLAAVPIAVLLILRLGYFHALVPNTFWAKMNAADGKDYTGAGYLASALERRPMLLLVLPAVALLPAPRSPPTGATTTTGGASRRPRPP